MYWLNLYFRLTDHKFRERNSFLMYTNFKIYSIPIMSFNIKNVLHSNGFGNKERCKSVYVILYESLKKAILNKTLTSGLKLPPTRVLAKDIGISRSTVLKAYDLLVLEKLINAIPGSGYYISTLKKEKNLHDIYEVEGTGKKYPKISKRGAVLKKGVQIIDPKSNSGIAFRPGLPPLDIFPVNKWKKLSGDYWRTVRFSQLSYSDPRGLSVLRENVASYLKLYRNIYCSPDQIIITTGALHSLSLIGDALIDKNNEVILENPTNPLVYNLFKSLRAKIYQSEIDDEGISIDNVTSKAPKLIYTTPSNQYPVGIRMTLKRRVKLLNWANKKKAFIIEDDYDHEFSNWGNPIPSIYSLDNQQRTIYSGTFNKLLHPSIRLGYMIVPYYLLDTIIGLYQQSNRFVSPATQNILSTFIEKGYLNQHLRSVIEASIERKASFLEHFRRAFDNEIEINSKNTGLHFIGQLNTEINDVDISNHFSNKGVITHPYSKCFIAGEQKNGLVMGYSSVNTTVIRETINRMKIVYTDLLNS